MRVKSEGKTHLVVVWLDFPFLGQRLQSPNWEVPDGDRSSESFSLNLLKDLPSLTYRYVTRVLHRHLMFSSQSWWSWW